MLISRLHLMAYGHFSDCVLDFGTEPGFHLIYGDNEAGKSTTLRALSSVLFGYPHVLVDGFKHDAKDIAIGADISAKDGRRLSFVRKRRGKNTLAGPDGAALDESVVTAILGGVSRDVFEKVFALNHQRLREHARGLLAEGGSLGFSLAEAGSGIAGLKAVLDRLRQERTALFLAAGSKPKLNQQIARLNELRKESRRRTVSPGEYKKRQKEIEEIAADLKVGRERQKKFAADIRRLERIAKNLPLRVEHHALTRKIDELANIPLLLPEVTEQRVKALAELDAAVEDENAAMGAITAIQESMGTIVFDDVILTHGQDIERVAEQRPVIRNTEIDIPKREAERNQHVIAAGNLLAQAELVGDPGDLGRVIPSSLKRTAIATLAEAGTKLIAQKSTAAKNAEKAADNLKTANEHLAQVPKPRDASELVRALMAAERLGDITADIARRIRGLERKSQALNEAIGGLGIKAGTISALRELAVPPEKTATRFADVLAGIDKEIATAGEALGHFDHDIADVDKRIAALEMHGGVATEEELKAARLFREQGWALVRGLHVDGRSGLEADAKKFAGDRKVADVYEKHVAEADRIVDVIRGHIKEATELSLLRRQKLEIATRKTTAEEHAAVLSHRRAALITEWRALWPAGLVPQLPGEMIEWLARRLAIIREAEVLDEERDALGEIVKKDRDAADGLVVALNEFAPAAAAEGLDRLRDHARRTQADVAATNAAYEKASEAVRAQKEHKEQAESALHNIERELDDWTKGWTAALEAANFRPSLSIAAMNVVLDIINNLASLKSKIDDLDHRITEMAADRARFAKVVSALSFLEPGAPEDDPVETSRRLEARFAEARSSQAKLKALSEQCGIQSTARDRARDRILRCQAVLAALCTQAGCSDPREIAAIEQKSAGKQGALRDRETIERRIREDGSGLDLETLFAECDGVVGDQIPGEVLLLKAESEEAEFALERLMSNRATQNAEFDRLTMQDQAADLMQDAANVEAEIGALVERYVDLTVQETLLRQAIELYRDRNQGPILMRAKNLFADLTDGAYAGLRADVDDKGEPVLVAEHATRGSLDLDALTDGTVDPLYLALRLAVIQEHNATREPLPFIADDLLLNFDNTRAQAALRTLAKIAASNQVLFFTHHAHMLDLARTAVPGPLLVEHQLMGATALARAAE